MPDLGDDSVKRLTAALSKTEGIVSAKAESDKGRFLVTFETAKTDAEALTVLVTNVAPDAKLEATIKEEPGASFEMAEPDEKGNYYEGYSIKRVPTLAPALPQPYCSFSETTPY